MAISSLIYRKVFIIFFVQKHKILKKCKANMDFISGFKALRLSQTAFQKTSNGKIVNLLSNDVNCLDWLLFYGNSLWSAPLLTIVCGFLMYDEIGWTAIIGIGVMLVIVPIQSWLCSLISLISVMIRSYSFISMCVCVCRLFGKTFIKIPFSNV